MTEAPVGKRAMPAIALVRRLLEHLQVEFVAERLKTAAQQLNRGREADSPSDWLRELLVVAEIPDLTPVLLDWRRFDPDRLPALIRFEDDWFFAGSLEDNGDITLATADEQTRRVSPADLDRAQVLWVRAAPRLAADATPAFSGNHAASLVWRELFRDRGWLWQLVVATLLVNLLAVSTSLFAMQVYDRVVPTMAYATLTALAVGMAIVILFDWTLKIVRARIVDSLACAVDQRISQQVFEHLLHLRLDAQPRSLGTLAAQISSLDQVRQFFSATIVFALVDLPFALLFLCAIAVIGGGVAWVYALLLPVALLLGLSTQWQLRRLFRSQLARSTERQGLLVDSIRGAETVRASNAGWRFAAEWRSLTSSINRFVIQQRALSSRSAVTTSSLSILAYVSGVIVGVWQIEAGRLTMGGLIACTILGGRIIAPVAQCVQYLGQWQHVREALIMVHNVLSLSPERRPDQDVLVPAAPARTMTLQQVRFAYGQAPVSQLTVDQLALNAGDRILLLGAVGSGKSTLLKVLAGLYRPSAGRVRLGDADLWALDPLLVSSQIGYLPQSVHLFRGTLRSNLNLHGSASDDRLLEISQALGLEDIAAESGLGLDLPISEGGDGLSGGQRQLVALARVVLEQPRIWLLDEPGTSLDRELEERVWRTLEAALQPDDILVVSTHRPLLAGSLVNRVLLMKEGRIDHDGSPETLLPKLAQRSPRAPDGRGPGREFI